jgi:hypothetical protein
MNSGENSHVTRRHKLTRACKQPIEHFLEIHVLSELVEKQFALCNLHMCQPASPNAIQLDLFSNKIKVRLSNYFSSKIDVDQLDLRNIVFGYALYWQRGILQFSAHRRKSSQAGKGVAGST